MWKILSYISNLTPAQQVIIIVLVSTLIGIGLDQISALLGLYDYDE